LYLASGWLAGLLAGEGEREKGKSHAGLAGWLAGLLAGWLTVWLAWWLTGWLAGWLAGLLACRLAGLTVSFLYYIHNNKIHIKSPHISIHPSGADLAYENLMHLAMDSHLARFLFEQHMQSQHLFEKTHHHAFIHHYAFIAQTHHLPHRLPHLGR
jgi:hypothetical protein